MKNEEEQPLIIANPARMGIGHTPPELAEAPTRRSAATDIAGGRSQSRRVFVAERNDCHAHLANAAAQAFTTIAMVLSPKASSA